MAGTAESLVKSIVVVIEVPAPGGGQPTLGTGFFVAPNLVATCAHVVARDQASVADSVRAKGNGHLDWISLRPIPERLWREPSSGLDLAILQVETDAEANELVPLSPMLNVGDPLWTYGHPDGQFRAGQPATFHAEGASRRDLAQDVELPRLRGTPVGPGFSGSPVLNRRTGGICGMLTTSDGSGGAHMLPGGLIAELVPESILDDQNRHYFATWLRQLTDKQIHAGQWCFPGPRLRAYLDVAARTAQSHPYPGVLPGGSPPPLSTVYVRQHAQLPVPKNRPQNGEADLGLDRLPAEAILRTNGDALVDGVAGSGKSCLLRVGLISLCERILGGREAESVPVRVLAADLVEDRPIPEAIAASVRADTGQAGALRGWPASFFREPPMPGARWLILIDGLDEIVDSASRRLVLTKLVQLRSSELSVTYRIVVASRPLPEDELDAIEYWQPQRYQLLPFGPGQVRQLAEGWFRQLGLPDPERSAALLTTAIKRSRLGDLAFTPLMATILCQVFAAYPERDLPRGRTAIYEVFLKLIMNRTFADNIGGLHQQTHLAVRRFGPIAAEAAAKLADSGLTIICKLALAHIRDDTQSLTEMLAAHARHLRPQGLADDTWRALVQEIARRSGLLVKRGGELDFIHQTVTEFLAARAAADDRRERVTIIREFFGRFGRKTPSENDSFCRFALAALNEDKLVVRHLRAAARKTGMPGRRIIIALVSDGVPVAPQVLQVLGEKLSNMATDSTLPGDERRHAVVDLVRLDHPTGINMLFGGLGVRRLPMRQRRAAGIDLARLGDPRGIEILTAMARDPYEPESYLAERALARIQDPEIDPVEISVAGTRHAWLVPGQLRATELAEYTGFRFPSGPYETLGGFLMLVLGRIPFEGDQISREGWTLTVVEMDGMRVDQVQLVRAE